LAILASGIPEIIIIIIIDTFIKRHKCLGYRGAGGDVNQADCRNSADMIGGLEI